MTASDQLLAATDEPSFSVVFAIQRRDFHCRRDAHRRPLFVLPTFPSLRDYLHPGALCGAILSATSKFMAKARGQLHLNSLASPTQT